MATKWCPLARHETEEEDWSPGASYCRPCCRDYQKARRLGNPMQRAYDRRYRSTHKERYQKHLLVAAAFVDAARASGCVDCGEKHLGVLDLDHVRGKKTANVSRLLGCSFKRLFAEIDKCEVRCANCHRKVTALRRRNIDKEPK